MQPFGLMAISDRCAFTRSLCLYPPPLFAVVVNYVLLIDAQPLQLAQILASNPRVTECEQRSNLGSVVRQSTVSCLSMSVD